MRVWTGEGIGLPGTLAVYYGQVLRSVRRELAQHRYEAARIPDPELRSEALEAILAKGSNAEAVAVFATLAPSAERADAIVAITALQTAVDFLDSVSEQPTGESLRDSLRLHSALAASLDPEGGPEDWYAHHRRHEDGGYLDGLLNRCRSHACRLPAATAILPVARRAAARCGAGQSHTHAAAANGGLREWVSELGPQPGFEWWEVAAGASSSVAAHALLALAATPGADIAEATQLDRAYFPAIGALTVLLDDLVDRAADSAAGEHSYLAYYATDAVAGERIAAIAGAARSALAPLRQVARHRAILAGVLAHYLSRPQSRTAEAQPIRRRALAAAGPTTRALTALLGLRGDE